MSSDRPAQQNGVATVVLPIRGMTCAACQLHVERSLKETAGVLDATVNLLAHSARVMYEPAQTSVGALVAAVDEAGYESSAAPDAAANASARPEDTGPSRRGALLALATIATGSLVMLVSMMQHGMLAAIAMGFVTLLGMATAGASVYAAAWRAALRRATNMQTLVALGTLAAFGYSAAASLWPALFLRHHMQPELYYDAVLFILGFLLLGNWLDTRARKHALDAVRALAQLAPAEAHLLREGREVTVPSTTVLPDDIVILRPGERVPVDGTILQGATSVDESMLTGESLPVPRSVGDALVAGSLNFDGAVEYRATAIGADSRLGQILRLVEQAQSSRAPMQQLADHVSRFFVPAILLVSLLSFAAWALVDVSRAFAIGVAVLVVACPCAMGLAVPAALTVAVGRGAQLGVLFKGGEALERLALADTVLLDKTGTLTRGAPAVASVLPAAGWSETSLLEIAASVEQRSEHPLARAVLDAARERGTALKPIERFTARPGQGVEAIVNANHVLAGNARLLAEHGVTAPVLENRGDTTLHLAVDGVYAGSLLCRDTLRHDAVSALQQLHALGLRPVILTGDTAETAMPVAEALGIDQVHAGLSPEAKLACIRAYQQQGRRVIMVGDGINDAAALALADAGIGMGGGTELARDAGDAILLHGSLTAIVHAIRLSRATRRVMKQNLAWAAGYNLLAIPLAAGALFPLYGILLSPAVASAAMALSSVSVLLNSLRLRHWRPA